MNHPVPGPSLGQSAPAPVPEHAVVTDSSSTEPLDEVTTTYLAEVAATVGLLDGLSSRTVSEHVEVFTEVHARLQGALTEIDTPGR